MKKLILVALFVIPLLMLAGCGPGSTVNLQDGPTTEIQFTLPGTNPEAGTSAENGRVAGLGTGLWHGLISVVTLIISFFNPVIQMYEVHNSGAPYNLGFLLGAALLFILLGYAGGRRR